MASGCPACGGAVETREVCAECGLQLGEGGGAPPGAGRKLADAILQKTASGVELRRAVEEACAELFPETPAPEETAEAARPASDQCPLCGGHAGADEPCDGCGLWLEVPRQPVVCGVCQHETYASELCECRAILSLERLLGSIDGSVKYVCARCHQPYVKGLPACPDCGGQLLGAAALQAYARRA